MRNGFYYSDLYRCIFGLRWSRDHNLFVARQRKTSVFDLDCKFSQKKIDAFVERSLLGVCAIAWAKLLSAKAVSGQD